MVREWQEKRGAIVFIPLTLFTAAIAIPSAHVTGLHSTVDEAA
jgi:hypothetical protein